jgi:hypothetical protein
MSRTPIKRKRIEPTAITPLPEFMFNSAAAHA